MEQSPFPTKSILEEVKVAPPNEIFHTAALFNKDPSPLKINLGVGAYRDNEGKPYVLKSVRKAEQLILSDTKLNHEYLGIAGDVTFRNHARELLFGKDNPAVSSGRITTVQTLSGTGALALAGDFIEDFLPKGTNVYVAHVTWPNHNQIYDRAPNLILKKYRYWDAKNRSLDLSGMLEDLGNAPAGSIIVLHACAHNPTGVDPTMQDWKLIAAKMKERSLIPLIDCAYQGFASGDLDRDAWAIRYFTQQNFEMFVTQSFAKNFGLYDTRTGTLSVVCPDSAKAAAVESQLEIIIRRQYSNPPSHGARIVNTILGDAALRSEWEEEMKMMSNRIKECRTNLFNELQKLGTPGDWNHVLNQIGMFCYTGLNAAQCQALRDLHVYSLLSGRFSMCGINTGNVARLAYCVDKVVREIK